MSWKKIPQRLGLGRVALHLFHRPLDRLRDSLRNGGPLVERETARQQRAMERAAADLSPLPVRAHTSPARLHLLTGRRFWYQTAFCLHSFAQHTERNVEAEIYDDGSFDAEISARLKRIGSGVTLHPAATIRERLEAYLPERKFPVLRERWRNYPNLRKLTDPHLGSSGWKLVIDSDLLFFRRPGFLLDWQARPHLPLHAIDCEESYGYSRNLMERLAGAPIPPLVNVGLCGLQSEALNWPELEAWTAELIAREKTSYYLEQALVAMLVARSPARAIAPAADYITKPGAAEVAAPQAVMHHYVAESKRWYFREGWRNALGSTSP